MKKGLRRLPGRHAGSLRLSDHRPDEEGIKTAAEMRMSESHRFQTTDLMKKGLRLRPGA